VRRAPAALERAIPLPADERRNTTRPIRALTARLQADFADAVSDGRPRGTRLHLETRPDPGGVSPGYRAFRFEGALLTHCGRLIAQHRFADAHAIVATRQPSFWLGRSLRGRNAQWEACRHAEASWASLSLSVRAALAGTGPTERLV
jgi:hypothetical protein